MYLNGNKSGPITDVTVESGTGGMRGGGQYCCIQVCGGVNIAVYKCAHYCHMTRPDEKTVMSVWTKA